MCNFLRTWQGASKYKVCREVSTGLSTNRCARTCHVWWLWIDWWIMGVGVAVGSFTHLFKMFLIYGTLGFKCRLRPGRETILPMLRWIAYMRLTWVRGVYPTDKRPGFLAAIALSRVFQAHCATAWWLCRAGSNRCVFFDQFWLSECVIFTTASIPFAKAHYPG